MNNTTFLSGTKGYHLFEYLWCCNNVRKKLLLTTWISTCDPPLHYLNTEVVDVTLLTILVMSYPYSVFTQLNMALVLLSGATSLPDRTCSNLLVQCMSSSPLVRARFSQAMDQAPLPAVHKSRVRAICTHVEAVFPAPYLIRLLLELGAARSGFRVLSEYITRQCQAYTARTGLPFPRTRANKTNLTQRGGH